MAENRWLRVAALAGVAFGMVACGGGDDATTDSANVAAGEVARADSAATAASPGAGTPTSPAPMSITGGDQEIAQFMAVVDAGEVQAGRVAQRQARNAQVKSFARTLVNEHTSSLRQTRQIARTANITLDTTMLSTATTGTGTGAAGATASATSPQLTGAPGQLHTMHQQAMQRLQNLQGADFDSAFMNAQVAGHEQVLTVLQQAQNQAQDSTLKQHVTKAAASVQQHLERARQVQQAVMTGGTGTGAAGDTTSKARSDTGRRG